MKLTNLALGTAERPQELWINHVKGVLDEGVRYAETVGAGAVKAQAVLAHGLVSTEAHVIHNGLRRVHDLARQGARTVKVLVLETAIAGKGDGPHGLS